MKTYKPKSFVLKFQEKISQHFQNGNFFSKYVQIMYPNVWNGLLFIVPKVFANIYCLNSPRNWFFYTKISDH